MKKSFFLFTVFAVVSNAFGQKQTIELTFTAQYQTQYVMLDSIYIENLTQGGDTMLYAPDTVLVLDFVTGVSPNPTLNEGFRVSQNRPNPFTEQTTISIFLPEADHLQMSVVNLLGQKVAFFENSLDAGKHSFVFYPGDDKYYILTATANGLTKTIKMISLNNKGDDNCRILFAGEEDITVNLKSFQDMNNFGFNLGDELKYVGYTALGQSIITDSPTGNKFYEFELGMNFPCPETPTITYQGQTYNTVQIGDQCWFKENLNVGTMILGSEEMTDNGIIEKYCYGDDPANCATYGGLYQWNEMMQFTTQQGTQGICPSGWHIPSDEEWCILTHFIDLTVDCNEAGYSGTDVGIKMKSTTGWSGNGNGTNESGFTALPGGGRNDQQFYMLAFATSFWTSSENDNFGAWEWNLIYDDASVSRGYPNKSEGLSVRCIQGEGTIAIPTVTTADINGVTQTTVTCGGEVIDDGGTNVVARGVCWSTSQNPTITDNHTSDGNGTGMFASNITGLTTNTPYFVRAYATNAIGTAYGNEVSFSTLPFSTCGDVISYEGQNYNTVQIGSRCWFKENLNVGTMIPGIEDMTDNGIIEKYCYNDDPANCATYGGLYQWFEMMQYDTQKGLQGICPAGWNLPSDADWTVLTDFLGGELVAGGKMKATGTIEAGTGLWHAPNTGATNESGFTALPGGWRLSGSGTFFNLNTVATYWAYTMGTTIAWYRDLYSSSSAVLHNHINADWGHSVRCLQDDTTTTLPTVTTAAVTDVTQTTATCGGEVINDGGAEVTERGVCWSHFENPSVADDHTSDGNGIGIFVSNITGLQSSTQYFVRTYAINSDGIAYANEVNFITLHQPCPGLPTVTYEGQTYNTVQIGGQCWFKENLNVGTMIDVSSNQTNNSQKEKYCYNNNEANCAIYGGLYQWNEMMQYTTQQETQGICPNGWHLPTDAEWMVITDFLGGEIYAGRQMKTIGTIEAGTGLWYAPNTGKNISGLTAIPGGDRSSNVGFYGMGDRAYFWSSTENNTNLAWFLYLINYNSNVIRDDYYKTNGMSVRCVKDEVTIPSVTTAPITEITQIAAIGGGEVTDDGGAVVSARGVCWSTSQNPTISDNHTNDGTGTGTFESNIAGLTLNTPYFVRAYATNSAGTAYGNEVTFTTLPVFNCGDVVNYVGQNYNTILIGTQCWFKENLNVGTMINGNSNQTNNSQIEKYCYYQSAANCATYGGLYQWDEMMQYTTQQGTQGICPYGWHLPSDAEWCTLTLFIDPTVDWNAQGWSGTDVGTKMKSTTGWNPGGNGTNASGFTAHPGGYRYLNGSFSSLGYSAGFWSSSLNESGNAWYRSLNYSYTDVCRDYNFNSVGYSVRCLQDDTSTTTLPTVTTAAVTGVTQTTATCGGEVIDNGGADVTYRGVCWSTDENPSVADDHTSDGNGNGIFVSNITGLQSSTQYFVRTYANNSEGTGYGNEVNFITLHQPCPDIPTVTYEGQTYNTVQIGDQCWFKENLNVGTMIDASSNQTNNSQKEKYCYNNNEANCIIYGGLYQWDEMMQYTTQQGTQGICPGGWHIPTDAEWTVLTNFLGGELLAGRKMKSIGTIEAGTGLWYAPNTGNNISGLTAIPGGKRSNNGSFYSIGEMAYFWSSTENNTNQWSWFLRLTNVNGTVIRDDTIKTIGYSVRCVQD